MDARARAAASGDPDAEAAPLHLQAAGLRLQGDYPATHALYLESLALNRRLGNDAWVAMEEHNLGWVALHLDNLDAAEEWFLAREAHAGPDAYGDAWRRLNQAGVAACRGRLDEARHLLANGGRTLENLGVALDPDDQAELDWLTGKLGERHPSGR